MSQRDGTKDWVMQFFPNTRTYKRTVAFDIFPGTLRTLGRLAKQGGNPFKHKIHHGGYVFKDEKDVQYFRDILQEPNLHEEHNVKKTTGETVLADGDGGLKTYPHDMKSPKFHGYKINVKPTKDGRTSVKFPTKYRAVGVFHRDATNEITLRLRPSPGPDASEETREEWRQETRAALFIAHQIPQEENIRPSQLNLENWIQGEGRNEHLKNALSRVQVTSEAQGKYNISAITQHRVEQQGHDQIRPQQQDAGDGPWPQPPTPTLEDSYKSLERATHRGSKMARAAATEVLQQLKNNAVANPQDIHSLQAAKAMKQGNNSGKEYSGNGKTGSRPTSSKGRGGGA